MKANDSVSSGTFAQHRLRYCMSLLLFFGFLLLSKGSVLAGESRAMLPDQVITEAAESALSIDKSVPSHLIDVHTHQGIVTLVGNVPHYRAKERAAQLVETVKGVESVINGLTVKISQRSDEDILQDMRRVLQEDPVTDAYDITATLQDGVVTLSGTVPSLAAKELVAWVVSGVRGVRDVENTLVTELKETRSDSVLLEEIQKRLKADVWVNEESVFLAVKDGVVTLDGVVGSVAEKRRVVRDAGIAGVKEIDESLLFVKAWAQGNMQRKRETGFRSDEEIKETLELAFLYDPRVSAFNPTISVRQGIVTLTGLVSNLKAKRAAEDAAKYTRGVQWVKNFLKVRPEGEMSDEKLSRKVKLALHDNPFVNSLNIGVFVLLGRAILHGEVESEFQKKQAEESAAGVTGVVEIKNNLIVKDSWTWRPDSIIKRDIENELWWSPYVDSDEVEVSVKQGVATLSGVVDSYLEYEMAIENAREGGAKQVESMLRIRKYIGLKDVLPDGPM